MVKGLLVVSLSAGIMACANSDAVTKPERTVDVFISAGKKQCEQGSGFTLNATKAMLAETGVRVIQSSCGQRTDMMLVAMCGAGTTDIHIHRIGAEELTVAQSAGFYPLAKLARGGQENYQVAKCRQ